MQGGGHGESVHHLRQLALGVLRSHNLERFTNLFLEEGRKNEGFFGLSTMYSASAPQLFADIDRAKARALKVKVEDINQAFDTLIGSDYVNNFNAFGRYWQVNLMADLGARGMTMVVVTHEMNFAREVSNHLLFLHQGRIEEQGNPREVLVNPKSERLAQFLSGKLK